MIRQYTRIFQYYVLLFMKILNNQLLIIWQFTIQFPVLHECTTILEAREHITLRYALSYSGSNNASSQVN